MTTHHHVLVTAGTGKSGRRVVRALTEQGHAVRVGSRAGTPPFDWGDRCTWDAALDGVTAAYLAYLPDIGAPQAADDLAAFAALAVDRGVRRAVLLSGRNEPTSAHCEEVVRSFAWEASVVRAAFFDQDFSEAFLLDPVLSGVVAFPAGQVPEPLVDVEDVAAVAAAALTGAGPGEVYEVTGPESLTFGEAVAHLATATGRDLRYEPVTTEEYAAALVSDAGLPADEAGSVADLFGQLCDGRNAYVGDGVQRALGREPRRFADFAGRTATTGVWTP